MAGQFINAWGRDFQEVHGAVAKSMAKPPPVSPELLRQLAMQQAAAKATSSEVFSTQALPQQWQAAIAAHDRYLNMPKVWQAAPAAKMSDFVRSAPYLPAASAASLSPPATAKARPKSPPKAPPPAKPKAAEPVSSASAASQPSTTEAPASAKTVAQPKRTRPRGGQHKDRVIAF